MKTSILRLCFIFLIASLCNEAIAGTIKGTISYTGAATGQVLLVASTDSTFANGPKASVLLDSLGSYSLINLSDGEYFILSTMTNSPADAKVTDPWGFYGSSGKLTPVIISGNDTVSNINITLFDGAVDYPNPFHRNYISPVNTVPLPKATQAGVEPALATDGTSFYLYKHDSVGAGSAKIFTIDPSSGNVTATNILSLTSSPNGISWIDNLLFVNNVLWGMGGYGDPSGSGGVEGVFKVDINASESSSQIPLDTAIVLATGFASDGTNFYVAADSMGVHGIVKFNPAEVAKVPASLFLKLVYHPISFCYGDGYLWLGEGDSIAKIDPASGRILGSYNLPTWAAGLYFNGMLWDYYDEEDSSVLQAYNIAADAVQKNKNDLLPSNYSLSQNYPNPFNPTTVISYQLPTFSNVILKVYDVLGREVGTLVNERQIAGSHSATFNASRLSSGVYFYRLQAGSYNATKKLLLMK